MSELLEGTFAHREATQKREKKGGRMPAPRSGAAPAALPCLNSNNSIHSPLKTLPKAAQRTAYALTENVKIMAAKWGVERLGFLTLTFRDHVTDIKEAQKRFNSLRSNVLAERYDVSIAVVERMNSARIHFHLLVVLPADIRTGFDFEGVSKNDYRSANKTLRDEWAFWRKTAPLYGFGRTELLPVKSTAEGVAKYVGKYIAKHLEKRRDDDKGARLVRYSVAARHVSQNFAWVTPGAKLWRERVGEITHALGSDDMTIIKAKWGDRWAYNAREQICTADIYQWREFILHLATTEGGTVHRKALRDHGELTGVSWLSSDDMDTRGAGPLFANDLDFPFNPF